MKIKNVVPGFILSFLLSNEALAQATKEMELTYGPYSSYTIGGQISLWDRILSYSKFLATPAIFLLLIIIGLVMRKRHHGKLYAKKDI